MYQMCTLDLCAQELLILSLLAAEKKKTFPLPPGWGFKEKLRGSGFCDWLMSSMLTKGCGGNHASSLFAPHMLHPPNGGSGGSGE